MLASSLQREIADMMSCMLGSETCTLCRSHVSIQHTWEGRDWEQRSQPTKRSQSSICSLFSCVLRSAQLPPRATLGTQTVHHPAMGARLFAHNHTNIDHKQYNEGTWSVNPTYTQHLMYASKICQFLHHVFSSTWQRSHLKHYCKCSLAECNVGSIPKVLVQFFPCLLQAVLIPRSQHIPARTVCLVRVKGSMLRAFENTR